MDEQFSYEGLYRLLEERRAKRPEGSYTTYLFEKGLDKILAGRHVIDHKVKQEKMVSDQAE